MAPLSSLLTVALASSAAAFSPAPVTSAVRPSTKLYENFGFDFAEDQVENTPQIILGEANYKKWVNSVDPDNMLNRQVRYIKGRRRRNLLGFCVCVFLGYDLMKLEWNKSFGMDGGGDAGKKECGWRRLYICMSYYRCCLCSVEMRWAGERD